MLEQIDNHLKDLLEQIACYKRVCLSIPDERPCMLERLSRVGESAQSAIDQPAAATSSAIDPAAATDRLP